MVTGLTGLTGVTLFCGGALEGDQAGKGLGGGWVLAVGADHAADAATVAGEEGFIIFTGGAGEERLKRHAGGREVCPVRWSRV